MTDIDWTTIANELYAKHGIDHVAVERRLGEEVAIHYIAMPTYFEDGYYRAVLSIEGFGNRQRKRTFKKGEYSPHYIFQQQRHFAMQRRDDWEFRELSLQESFEKRGIEFKRTFSELPLYEHASIWDFYKAIGYDYKKKRYLPVA